MTTLTLALAIWLSPAAGLLLAIAVAVVRAWAVDTDPDLSPRDLQDLAAMDDPAWIDRLVADRG